MSLVDQRSFQLPSNQHLTDEQLTGMLLGESSSAVESHLVACSACAAEADRVASAIGSFRSQSRLWAERQASCTPALQISTAGSASRFFGELGRRWIPAAAAVALAAAIGLSVRLSSVPASRTAAVSVAVHGQDRLNPTTLQQDNRLLSAIDGELRADSSAPPLYGLDTASSAARGHDTRRSANE